MKKIEIAEMITNQIALFWLSVIYGIILGLWYEFFRVLRKNFMHTDRVVHLEDVIFCVTAAMGLFALFQVYNQGIIRFYCLAGIECGILFYFFVCSKWIEKILFYLVNISGKVIKKIGSIVFYPVKLIVKNTEEILKNIRRTIRIIRKHK